MYIVKKNYFGSVLKKRIGTRLETELKHSKHCFLSAVHRISYLVSISLVFFFQPADMSEARFWVLYFIIYILSNISSKNSLQISSNLQLNV